MTTTHYKRHCGQRDFARNATKLRIELRLGSPRRHLDVYLELLEHNLSDAGDSVLAKSLADELEGLRRLVAGRSHLQVVR